MDIILKKDVEHLGFANDVVKVKDGYARNYLLPRGLAVSATEGERKQLAENIQKIIGFKIPGLGLFLVFVLLTVLGLLTHTALIKPVQKLSGY